MNVFWIHFFNALEQVCIFGVLPVLIIWLVGRVRQHETDRKAEIMLKALDNGAKIDTEFFRGSGKTIKERLLGKLTVACIMGLIGLAILAVTIYIALNIEKFGGDYVIVLFTAMAGGILLAVGLAFFIVYLVGRRLLAKEIAVEEKQISRQE